MLDLVEDVHYSSRFLEPGCGSGNFLVTILDRKLDMVNALPEVRRAQGVERGPEYEFKSLIALASIYGIDIDQMNVDESRARLRGVALRRAEEMRPRLTCSPEYSNVVEQILETNIVLGDLLGDLRKITLCEYSELPGRRIKRRLFRFNELIYPVAEVVGSTPVMLPHIPHSHAELPAVPYRALAAPIGDQK